MGRWTNAWKGKIRKKKHLAGDTESENAGLLKELSEYEKAKLALEKDQEDSEDPSKDNHENKKKTTNNKENYEKYLNGRPQKGERDRSTPSADHFDKNLQQQVKILIDGVNGFRGTAGVLVHGSDIARFSEIEPFERISLRERADAACELWHFAFMGEDQKNVVAHFGGIEACMNILKNTPILQSNDERRDLLRLMSDVLAIIRSLCELNESQTRMTCRGLSKLLIAILDDWELSTLWSLALQILSIIVESDKSQREQVLQTGILSKLFGDSTVREGHPMLEDGRESYSIPALHFVEVILTKNSIRTKLIETTRFPEVLLRIFELSNLDTRGVTCRIISRLCQNEKCRAFMRRINIHKCVASFFEAAFSSINIGAAGAALGAISCVSDVDLALIFIPHACKIFKSLENGSSKRDWEFCNLALPGILRATRTFADIPDIQQRLRIHIPVIVSIIAEADSSDISKCDCAYILGSLAKEQAFHKEIMIVSPSAVGTLFQLIRTGSSDQRVAAGRAIQYLCYNPDLRNQIASFTHKERVMVNKTTFQEINRVSDTLDAVVRLLNKDGKFDSRCYGVGIIQNLAAVESFRMRIMQKIKEDKSIVQILAEICSTHISRWSRLSAATAIGNLCRDKEMALILSTRHIIQSISSLLFIDVGAEDHPNALECKETSVRTLGLLAYSEEAVREMFSCGIIDATIQLLTSQSHHMRSVAAKSIQNMACYSACSPFVQHQLFLETVFGILQRSLKENDVSEPLIAAIANFALNKKNISFLITNLSCPALVLLARRGSAIQKSHAAFVMREAASCLDVEKQRLLVKAGAIPALVCCLNVDISVPGGAAENSAAALERLVAGDSRVGSICMKNNCIEPLLALLSCGCYGARIQATKALIILADDNDYCVIIKQQGGRGKACGVLTAAEGELARLIKILLDQVDSVSFQQQITMSQVERQKVAALAVIKAKAESLRNQEKTRDCDVLHFQDKSNAKVGESRLIVNMDAKVKFPQIRKILELPTSL